MPLYTAPVKLQQRKTDGTYSVTIPKSFAEELNLEKGDKLFIKIEPKKNRFILSPGDDYLWQKYGSLMKD